MKNIIVDIWIMDQVSKTMNKERFYINNLTEAATTILEKGADDWKVESAPDGRDITQEANIYVKHIRLAKIEHLHLARVKISRRTAAEDIRRMKMEGASYSDLAQLRGKLRELDNKVRELCHP